MIGLSRLARARRLVGCKCATDPCTHYSNIREALSSVAGSKHMRKRFARMTRRTANAPKGNGFKAPGSQNVRKIGR